MHMLAFCQVNVLNEYDDDDDVYFSPSHYFRRFCYERGDLEIIPILLKETKNLTLWYC